jgi:hypothetical protein
MEQFLASETLIIGLLLIHLLGRIKVQQSTQIDSSAPAR